MKKFLYSVYDRKVGYTNILSDVSDEVAQRAFSLAVNTSGDHSLIGFAEEDFSLYCLAEFDTESGLVESYPVPKFICTASEVMKQKGV